MRAEEGRWMIIRRRSGQVVEESTVYVSAQVKPRRNRRKGATTAQKQDENEWDCVKRLARVLNCNYQYGDLLLTAKIDGAGMERLEAWARAHQAEGQTWEDAMYAAERAGDLDLQSIRRALAAEGVRDFRYVVVASDMDGETGEAVRPHIHLVVPRVSFAAAAQRQEVPLFPEHTQAGGQRALGRAEGRASAGPGGKAGGAKPVGTGKAPVHPVRRAGGAARQGCRAPRWEESPVGSFRTRQGGRARLLLAICRRGGGGSGHEGFPLSAGDDLFYRVDLPGPA